MSKLTDALADTKNQSPQPVKIELTAAQKSALILEFKSMLGPSSIVPRAALLYLDATQMQQEIASMWHETSEKEQREIVSFNLLLNDVLFEYVLRSPYLDASFVTTLQSITVLYAFVGGKRASSMSRSFELFPARRAIPRIADTSQLETLRSDLQAKYDGEVVACVIEAMSDQSTEQCQLEVKQIYKQVSRADLKSVDTLRKATELYLRRFVDRQSTAALMVPIEHSVIRAFRAGYALSLIRRANS